MIGQLGFEALDKNNGHLRNKIVVRSIPNAEANEIVRKFHYLHRKRTGGCQISYGVLYQGELVGALIYASPTFHHKKGLIPPLKPGQVIELARMWMSDKAPKHSETCALGKSLRIIREQWCHKYGVMPRAVISFSDLEFGFEGIIYKAANFIDLGFAKMARFADAGRLYSRSKEGYGCGHYSASAIKVNAPRTSTTKRAWLYVWDKPSSLGLEV